MKRQYQKWSEMEQQLLISLVKGYTDINIKPNWFYISQQLKTKSQRQCFDFYSTRVKENQVLNRRHKWTDKEKEKLLTLSSQGDWERIMADFKYLSLSQIKNKLSHIQSKTIEYTKQDTSCFKLLVFQSPEFVYFEN